MNTRDSHFLAFTQRLIDVQRRYPTMIPENVKAVATAESYLEQFPKAFIDINAIDPNDHRKDQNAEGTDERLEREERAQDYEERGGMK